MEWRVEVVPRPEFSDPIGNGVAADIAELGVKGVDEVRVADIYLLTAHLDEPQIERLCQELLTDTVVQEFRVNAPAPTREDAPVTIVQVFRKPGVMDPVAASAIKGAADLGLKVSSVRTGKKYLIYGALTEDEIKLVSDKLLHNAAIEDAFVGDRQIPHSPKSPEYHFERREVPLADADDQTLLRLSREWVLSLNLKEMKTIQSYYRDLGRNPTDVELETLAQTWSEHCVHKTFRARISCDASVFHRRRASGDRREAGDRRAIDDRRVSGEPRALTDRRTSPDRRVSGGRRVTPKRRDAGDGRVIDSLLKTTVVRATEELNKPWCVSVFKDNAGVIRFDDNYDVCFKVETHNHPSAIEPYGGAGTGIGGVIRDPLGTGLGAKPIVNTDIFCFGPPDLAQEAVPPGAMHPKRMMKGVVAGVRDYGNRMGIPTANGAVLFDERYIGNPLVYCGNVGLIPRGKSDKAARTGDAIIVAGGRTGRDGIHGATFSSIELTEESEVVSSGAVQIGNAIEEKRLTDVILQARDLGLYTCITDCGAGGLSSAVGEMGEELGAEVDLEEVPLKYEGLSYTEIWISEAQERMVMAVPPENVRQILDLFAAENVEATVIGRFTDDRHLRLRYQGTEVADLEMKFLHDGIPRAELKAAWKPAAAAEPDLPRKEDYGEDLKRILASWNVCSKEWVIRQYDHEVQGGSVLKPLQGVAEDGPGDACIVAPVYGSTRGIIISNGINFKYGDIDPYHMAACAIDEALRQIIAVGGDLNEVALLDNTCWGNTDIPERLGGMVRALLACYDMARVFGTPFISGKDSLNNEFRVGDRTISIPGTLLISAIGVMPDVTRAVSMDLKEPGNLVYVVGLTRNELGASHYYAIHDAVGCNGPRVHVHEARKTFDALSRATARGLARACHDCSEGGIAAAAAEMSFAGGLGMQMEAGSIPTPEDAAREDVALFSESASRFLVEVRPENQEAFERELAVVVHACIGRVTEAPRFMVLGADDHVIVDEPIAELKEVWQKPLRW